MRMWLGIALVVLGCGAGDGPFAPSMRASDTQHVTSVVVAPATVSLAVADTARLQAVVKGRRGIVLSVPVTWSSTTAGVATVSGTGLVTAVATGTARVIARVDTHADTTVITVTGGVVPPPVVASVVVAPATATLVVGGTVQLAATAKDAAGAVIVGRLTTWSSTNNAVAAVSATGMVTAVAIGGATVRATVDGVVGAAAITDTAVSSGGGGGGGTHAGYYVATTGSSSNTGSITSPWSLASVFAASKPIGTQDTVWVRAGTYTGNFVSNLGGGILRAYPGERATINGSLFVGGSNTTYWGLEVMNSAPLSGTSIGVNVKAPGTRLINLVVHDATYSGVGMWNEAPDALLYGSIIYNNGTHYNLDHGVYFNGNTGTKYVTDNIVFNNWAYGLHSYSPTTGELHNLRISGNASFNNGTIGQATHGPDLYVGGSVASSITVTNNMLYQWSPDELSLWFEGSSGSSSLTLTGNYVYGNTLIGTWSGSTQSGNTFVPVGSNPGGQVVLVRPNQYEPGRANIIVYNWSGAGTAAVNLSGIVPVGSAYTIHAVEAFYGAPVLQGIYGGGTVAVPMGAVPAPVPLGRSSSPPRSSGTQFHAFVVTTP